MWFNHSEFVAFCLTKPHGECSHAYAFLTHTLKIPFTEVLFATQLIYSLILLSVSLLKIILYESYLSGGGGGSELKVKSM